MLDPQRTRFRLRALGLVVSGGLVAALMVGCAPDLGDAPFICNAGNPRCPDGYVCNSAKLCVREGECPPDVPGCAGKACGDGKCEGGETCTSCEKDCGKCTGSCGDAKCEGVETCTSCEEDCGKCPSNCGDAKCEGDETCTSCEQDCGKCPSSCGDGNCDAGETCTSCESDCGRCPAAGLYGAVCSAAAPCDTGFTCLQTTGATKGFCSKLCTGTGTPCTGGPVGTMSFCIATVGTQTFCAFLCRVPGQTFNCPTALRCATTENPPGSGQFGCEP